MQILTRRQMLAHSAAILAAAPFARTLAATHAARSQSALTPSTANTEPLLALRELEHRSGGRLGLSLLDTASGRTLAYRAGERFPMCSTFKLLLAATVLHRVDLHHESLDRSIPIRREDLLPYAPATTPHAGASMSVAALCAAAITLSDNTAANLLLAAIGGPPQLTAFARTLGDPVTRLDRNEPTLNQALPNDPRDTTTPAAIARDLRTLILGEALTPASRAQLLDWLTRCQTGDHRIRAGVPATWRVGDKTGTGSNGTANDIAILYPPNRAPIVLAVYLTGATVDDPAKEALIAEAARIANP